MDKELEKQLALRKLELTKLSLKTTLTRRNNKDGTLSYKHVIDKIATLKPETPDFQN